MNEPPIDQPFPSAWFSATLVYAPAAECSHTRLYEPTDLLILVRDG